MRTLLAKRGGRPWERIVRSDSRDVDIPTGAPLARARPVRPQLDRTAGRPGGTGVAAPSSTVEGPMADYFGGAFPANPELPDDASELPDGGRDSGIPRWSARRSALS
jgi:hypothetical protein